MRDYGITLEEAADVAIVFANFLPPISETDITLIENNLTLNFWQKRKLKREIRESINNSK